MANGAHEMAKTKPAARSSLAVAAGYLGLASLLLIPGPIAFFVGIIALIQLEWNPRLRGQVPAIFGTLMGGVGSLGLAAAAIALVFYLRDVEAEPTRPDEKDKPW